MNLIPKYTCKNPHKVSATGKKDNISLDCGVISEMLVLFCSKILINVTYHITILKWENHRIIEIGGVKSLDIINNIVIIEILG